MQQQSSSLRKVKNRDHLGLIDKYPRNEKEWNTWEEQQSRRKKFIVREWNQHHHHGTNQTYGTIMILNQREWVHGNRGEETLSYNSPGYSNRRWTKKQIVHPPRGPGFVLDTPIDIKSYLLQLPAEFPPGLDTFLTNEGFDVEILPNGLWPMWHFLDRVQVYP